jgi:outer membrane protein
MKKYITLILSIIISLHLYSQKQWSLRDCIDYAKEHNLSVSLSKLNDDLANENVKTSKAALNPSVAFTSGQNFSYTNDSEKGIYSGTYGINASMDLYDGGKNWNDIKQKTLAKQIAEIGVKEAEDNIELSLTQSYIQELYALEAVKTAENNLALSQSTLDRSKELLKVGSISEVDYSLLESENSSYKYKLVESQNTYSKQQLELKQLMELRDNIDIKIPTINQDDIVVALPDVETIYQKALTFVPAILSAKKSKESSELEIKTAKGGYLPSVSLNAGVNTGHNSESDYALSKQLRTSMYENVGLNVSIPIYDKRQTKSNIITAQNQVLVNENTIQSNEKDLYKTIDELHLDCISYQNSYVAAKSNLESAQKSYNLVEQQFNLGLKNTIELLNQRTTLINAEQNLLQAKYQALMKLKLLDYYQNKTIEL